METNEQGLTREEKIMFFILGVILMVAVGVLIIDGFSKNDKSLKSETPTSEVETGKEESNTEDTESLKEAEEVESETKETNNEESEKENSEKTESNEKETVVEEQKENNEEKEKEQEGNGEETVNNEDNKGNLPYTAADDDEYVDRHNSGWDFNREVVTEAYTGTKIHINKNVVLENGVMEEAVVTVRKVIGNRLVIIDTKNDEFIAEEGTYVYSYTHNNLTKEIKLKVYNKLDVKDVTILGLKETEEVESIDTEISKNNHKAHIAVDEDVYFLTAVNNNKTNEVLIKVKLNNHSDRIISHTRGVKVLETSEELKGNEVILLINLDLLSKEDTNVITLNIDGTNYIFKLKVRIVKSSVEAENEKGESKENTGQNKVIVEEPPELEDDSLTEITINEETLLSDISSPNIESQSLEDFP